MQTETTILIREAREKDIPSILPLYAQLGMDDGKTLTIEEARQAFEEIQSYPYYRVYAAVCDNRTVGVFSLLIMDHMGHNGAPSGILEDMVVHPDYRGRGIGTRMVQFAMERCGEMGCYKIMLSSNVRREKAHRFYESLGFRKHGYSFLVDCKG